VLAAATAGAAVETLGFFHWCESEIAGVPVTISRTGYTGDIGFEVWAPAQRALAVWDALVESGRSHHLMPCGLAAMDLARVEAGFVLLGVDYVSAEKALIPSHRIDPFELGLGWAVKLGKARRSTAAMASISPSATPGRCNGAAWNSQQFGAAAMRCARPCRLTLCTKSASASNAKEASWPGMKTG
jgi:glycine cleavage system aminomethyltransferase T